MDDETIKDLFNKIDTKKNLRKFKKSMNMIYDSIDKNLSDLTLDILSPFSFFKALVNSIHIAQKLIKNGFDKKETIFFVIDRIIENNISEPLATTFKEVFNQVETLLFDNMIAIMKSFKSKCCCKKPSVVYSAKNNEPIRGKIL